MLEDADYTNIYNSKELETAKIIVIKILDRFWNIYFICSVRSSLKMSGHMRS